MRSLLIPQHAGTTKRRGIGDGVRLARQCFSPSRTPLVDEGGLARAIYIKDFATISTISIISTISTIPIISIISTISTLAKPSASR